MLTISKLTTENLENFCVTDSLRPRFSFALESDKNDVRLKKATISVNDWVIETKSQINNVYTGKLLQPFTTYTLKVVAEDNYGEKAEKTMIFQSARHNTKWVGNWITDGSYKFKEKKASPSPMFFKKNFILNKKVKSAQVFATALGIYEININGQKVGKNYFAPGFTSYRKRMQYQVYDITSLLTGNDELFATVAGGWAVGKFTHCLRNRIFAKRQALLCELRICYEDGSIETIGSDSSWQVTRVGNLMSADFYDGETIDARIKKDEIAWHDSELEKLKITPLYRVTYGALVTAHESFVPKLIHKSADGKLFYDFGQNFAGVIDFKLDKCKNGQTVIFKHAEVMLNNELFLKPLRTAKAQVTYTCNALGTQQYSPRFTYMGFRYVSVEGIAEENLTLKAVALYSDMAQSGGFSCSNEMLNKLQSNIVWSAKSNFIDIPTDCPQRDERMGWTGDIALFAPTASYNFDTSRFYEKWLKDLRADQKKTGGVPVTIPHVVFPSNLESVFTMAIDHWGDSVILVPWAEYRARGDEEILRKLYPAMKKYLKACKFWAGFLSVGKRRRIWQFGHHYGDWCAPNIGLMAWMGRGKWTATACFAYSCLLMSKIAAILHQAEDAEYYLKLHHEISDAYISVFTDKKGKLKKEFQTGYVLPLFYGIFKGEQKKVAAENLAKLIRDNNYHIGTGFPGTPYVLFALADNGLAEDAYKMLLTDTCPSWLHEVKVGGTTIWERWDALKADGTTNTGADDGTHGMVSFNHYANGAVGDFFYKRIAGLEAIEGGYKLFRIKPLMGGGISSAEAWHMTPYGKAASSWEIKDGQISVTAQVPVSCRCQLIMPDGTEHSLSSGTYTFRCAV